MVHGTLGSRCEMESLRMNMKVPTKNGLLQTIVF